MEKRRKLYEELDEIFHPRSMAAVGVSRRMDNMGMGFLIGYQKMGFKGPLYAINPRHKFDKFPTYPSVLEVPGPVDFVKICIPAAGVPEVLAECAKKGVKAAVIFSSGFRESGTAEGAALEEEIIRIAKKTGLRIIGPNCMGIYHPEAGMNIRPDIPAVRGGRLTLIGQSGGICISSIMAAAEKGLGFRKAVSYGNEADLGPPEFLHYFSRDPEVSAICLYIEGTRRPHELRAAMQDAAARKPLIVLKGGTTEQGNKAVSSHTGAMAGSYEVWKGLIRQCGGIPVEDIEEMLDLAMVFELSRPPRGKRLCLITVSGGFGVFATDQVAKAGFEMPPLSEAVKNELKDKFLAPGTSLENPLDLAARFFQPHRYELLFSSLDRDKNFDALVVMLAMEYITFINSKAEQLADLVTKALLDALGKVKKPVFIVFYRTALDAVRTKYEKQFIASGFPVYLDIKRLMKAISSAMSRG